MKSIMFVCFHDSSIKASIPIREHFVDKGWNCKYFLVHDEEQSLELANKFSLADGDYSYGHLDDFKESLQDIDFIDVFHLVLPGHVTRNVSAIIKAKFQDDRLRPIVVVGLVGLLATAISDCYFSRQMADLIYVGSQADLVSLKSVARNFGDDDNCIVATGLPLFDDIKMATKKLSEPTEDTILFVGQPTFPRNWGDRMYVVEKLIEIAKANPQLKVVIKPRIKLSEITFHKTLFHYEELLDELKKNNELPDNIEINYDDIKNQIYNAKVVVSISSTAVLEALVIDKKVAIVSDFGVTEAYANHFFLGSNLFSSFEEIKNGIIKDIDPTWESYKLVKADDCCERIYSQISEKIIGSSKAPFKDSFWSKNTSEWISYKLQVRTSKFKKPTFKLLESIIMQSIRIIRKSRLGDYYYRMFLAIGYRLYKQSK